MLKSRILPPTIPPAYVPRPKELFADTFERRLTTVVAGPGFGKSTALGAWAATINGAWYTIDGADARPGRLAAGIVSALHLRVPELPDDMTVAAESAARGEEDLFAAVLCEALEDQLDGDLALVLDDAHELGLRGPGPRLLESIVRQAPPKLHVVFSSRAEPPFSIERLRGRGDVLELDARSLALSRDEIASLLVLTLDEGAAELAGALHDLTLGWPAAVRLALEALRTTPAADRSAALSAVREPGGPLYAYLAEEVFAREAPAVRRLLGRVAPLDRFTPDLCEVLGVRRARATLAGLLRRGLFVDPQSGGDDWFALHALAREFVRVRSSLADEELAALHRRAADWFEAHGHFEDALRSLVAAGDPDATAAFLLRRGSALTAAGAFGAIIEAGASLPVESRDISVDVVIGEAHIAIGELERGRDFLARAEARSDALSADLAARIGLAYLDRPQKALAILRRAVRGRPTTEDEAFVLGLMGQVACVLGDIGAARKYAERALGPARQHGWTWPEAEAHLSLGLAASREGDLGAAEVRYRSALQAAERGGNVAQICTARVRTATVLIERGRYDEALTALEPALHLSDVSGLAILRGWSRSLRGEAALALGRLDEARADFEAGRAIYERAGSRFAGKALCGLGDVHRERGELGLARSAYEEALALAEEAEILVLLVPALAGLARLLVADDDEEAARLAGRAVALGPSSERHVAALLAAGWVELWRREREQAGTLAELAAAEARRRGHVAGLAESLELEALAAVEPARERRHLEEAVLLWRELANPLGEARAELALARLSTRPEARSHAERAERRLRALGVRPDAAAVAAGLLAALPWPDQAPVAIQSLGGFRVLRDGMPVGTEGWRRSRKARDLLKILVVRRGRPAPRDLLMEALWPGGDPEELANRLSVALATVRHVLDPERRFSADHYVRAEGEAVALDLSRLPVDVERFLALAEAGLSLRREGQAEEAIDLLEAAEEGYAGDFLEEDLYQDWAEPLREEARATYLAVSRALAETATAAGDPDTAVRYLFRMLERDAHDEAVHLALVSTLAAAGLHGEARRRYLAYVARMEEIGVEPAPFPSFERTPTPTAV